MIIWLFVGGMLVTGSANAVNQVVEKDTDAMMKRTAKRCKKESRRHCARAPPARAMGSSAGFELTAAALAPDLKLSRRGATGVIAISFRAAKQMIDYREDHGIPVQASEAAILNGPESSAHFLRGRHS